MGLGSLILAGLGVVAMMFHYVTHGIIWGIVCSLLLIGAFVLGTVEMKRKEKAGDFVSNMYNFAMLGHGVSGVVIVVCGIMCIIASVMQK
ncbi:MAG: hypothetical protein ACI4RK_09255 [Oscillospiraceae bacterium]